MRCTKAVIYQDNLRGNLAAIRRFVRPETKICVAVKADGYGCGAVTAAKVASECGADFLAVATVGEGVELRRNGVSTPVLLLSLCTKDETADLVRYKITPLVFDSEMIRAVSAAAASCSASRAPAASGGGVPSGAEAGRRFGVFLAVDTGMGRIGCAPDEAAKTAAEIEASGSLRLAGMITHFAVSDSTRSDDRLYTERQFADFQSAVACVRRAGIDPGICSCSSSAATLDRPEMQLDMVRPGIAVYGYYPDRITRGYLAEKGTPADLKPVMQLETEIVAIRRFRAGSSVSYGRTWTAGTDTDIAVLPIGYADGLLRRCSPGLEVSVNGRLYPVRGRICMDQCMIDIGPDNPDVRRWDKAVIFGPKEGGALRDAADIAELTDTIPYEIMTAVTKRVERVVV